MRSRYECAECGALTFLPLTARTVTCHRCGDVCFVTAGAVQRMYPALHMRPIDHPHGLGADYPPSKWMPTHTRPVAAGMYECRFRHIEPEVVRLYWNGWRMQHDGVPVDMSNFLTWRGVLS